jgi:outer membrane lipoprotein-sorting protein
VTPAPDSATKTRVKKQFFCVLALAFSSAWAQETSLPESDDEGLEIEAPVATVPPAKPAAKKDGSLDSKTRLILRTVSERYKELKDWSAEFNHETSNVGLGTGTVGKGRFYFVRPNKFRYSITEPEASDFICDGKQAWLIRYPQGRGNAARVQHFKDVSRIELDRYLLVLKGIDATDPASEARLMKEFKISGSSDKSEIRLSLEPIRPSEIARLDLHFPQRKVAPGKVVITDALGNTTTLSLTKTNAIKKTLPEWFRADYPAGSKVDAQ